MPRFAAVPSRARAWLAAVLVLFSVACDSSSTDPDRAPGSGVETLLTPTEVTPGVRYSALGAGWFHTCATAVDGTVFCWGKDEYGELGGTTPADRCDDGVFFDGVPCTGQPQPVFGAPRLLALDGSLRHTCGLDAAGRAWCWGFGVGGQLGDGGRTSRASAAPVAGTVTYQAVTLSLDAGETCGVGLNGGLYCWGPLDGTAMGMTVGASPTLMPATQALQSADHGALSACGVISGAAWCWGSNWYGQLGVGSTGQDGGVVGSVQPVRVQLGSHGVSRVIVSESYACGLDLDGVTHCWGYLPSVHGFDPPLYGPTPVPVNAPAFVEIVAGGNHSCGLTSSGEAWCWGLNATGALGDGTRADRAQPVRVQVAAGQAFSRLALGGVHSCGLTSDGRLFCWGDNGLGQAGQRPGWLVR